MASKLTVREVEGAKPRAKPYEMRDAEIGGLMLRVQPSGVKSFIVEWARGKRTTIGRYPVMTLDGARAQAKLALADVVKAGKPSTARERGDRAAIRTLGDFIDHRYAPHVLATAKAGKATVDALKAHFGHLYAKRLDAITRADFDAFQAKRLTAGTSPSTVNRDLDRIKAALARAVDWQLIPSNPFAAVRRIKRGIETRVRFLSKAETKALRKALDDREAVAQARRTSGNAWRSERGRDALPAIEGYSDHVAPMTLVALNTGLRRGELTQLTWNDVDLVRKTVTVRAGYAKSGRERHVPLNTEALAVLKRWKRQHAGTGRLFAIGDLKKAWAGLMAAAKIEAFRFHDLRHDFASRLIMAGVDLNTVRELLGHGDIKMTLRYAHLAPEHRAAAVEKLVMGKVPSARP